ncbi:MAG: BatD family protein [bacterium]
MIGKKAFLHIIILLLFPLLGLSITGVAQARSVSIQASVDKTELSLDDQLILSVVINGSDMGSLPDPELPEIEHFFIADSFQGSNFSWINGKVSASKTIRYILRPEAAGTFTIGPIKVSLDGQTQKTEPISVTVSQSGSPPASSPPYSSRQRPRSPFPSSRSSNPWGNEEQQYRGNIFITNTVDKNKVYVNEQIILTFGFYRRIDLWQNPTYTQPSLEGFWVEDLEAQPSFIRTVNGKEYRIQEIKKAIFPMSPGNRTIGPATLSYQAGFFSPPRTLKTEPVSIEVLPLPEEGKPHDFRGAVGNFTFSAQTDNRSGVQNEPITLHARIKGTGYIEGLPEPEFSDLEGFQKYDTTVSQTLIKQDRLQGEKCFDFLLIPRKTGNLHVPSLHFSFFNPKDKKYHTLTTDPILVSIAPGQYTAGADSTPIDENALVTKQEVTLNQKDIRYIKTDVKCLKKDLLLLNNTLFLSFLPFPLLLFIAVFWVDRRAQKFQGDPRYARLKRAHGLARKKLGQARVHDQKGEEKEFYAAISKSLTEYVADKLDAQAAGLTGRQMVERLLDMHIPKEVIDQLQQCLDECDYARFAPATSDARARKSMLSEAEQVICSIEKATREKK